jgi:hypothetical protein
MQISRFVLNWEAKIPRNRDLFIGSKWSFARQPKMVLVPKSDERLQVCIRLAAPSHITADRALLSCVDIEWKSGVKENKRARMRRLFPRILAVIAIILLDSNQTIQLTDTASLWQIGRGD